MTVLTRDQILGLLDRKDQKALEVTPLLSRSQVGQSSIDVRLGCEFLLPTRQNTSHISFTEGPDFRPPNFERTRREFQQPLYVHPRQFVLGATLEFVSLPDDVSAYVIGKSSLGRAGLVIATATAVAPGFQGCITLEIVNIGELPMPMYPGMRIAQLVLHKTLGEALYKGRFAVAIGPEPPKIEKDYELRLWMGQ